MPDTPSPPPHPVAPPDHRLSRAQFRAWTARQTRGRFERSGSIILAMAPERVGHARVKAAVWLELRRAIAEAGVVCEALPDGVTVEIGEDADYEPDAVVSCGERLDDDAIAAPRPVIVVEVESNSTRRVDSGAKLADYFRLPSLAHYLIVRRAPRGLLHHRRTRDGIATAEVTEGTLALDPPGIAIAVERLFTA